MKPYYDDGKGIQIYLGDCREVLSDADLPECHLALTDPPYCGVVGESWDNQWKNEAHFLGWLMECLSLVRPRVAPNGSLYVFASPQMAARVEVAMREQFDVLGSLVWDKSGGRKGAAGSGVDVTALRTYWTANTERCIFAGQWGADDRAAVISGYERASEAVHETYFADYLRGEVERSGITRKAIAALFPSRTGNITGCVANWLIGYNAPTAQQYEQIRCLLNDGEGDFLSRDYEEVRGEHQRRLDAAYKEQRAEGADAFASYEELRRPFNLTAQHQWGDVLRFPIERGRAHPTQKPLALIHQLMVVSSNTGQTVLDPFMGSGTTLRAAKDLGRKAIGIEIEERYCEIAAKRLGQEVLF